MTVKEANEPGTQLCLHYSGFDRGAKPDSRPEIKENW